MTTSSSNRPESLRIACIVFVCLGTYAWTLQSAFVWDDIEFIIRNRFVQDLGNLPRFLVSSDAEGTPGYNPYFRPLTTATFAIDYHFWGDRAGGFHATNVLLHLLTCIALYFTARRFTPDPNAALAATLLFAVHPAHSEPVGYISARADILCALLMLVSVLSFFRSNETGERGPLFLSIIAFALALFAKIVALVLPLLLASHLFLYAGRERRWRKLIPYGVVSLAFLLLRDRVLPVATWGGAEMVPAGIRIANAGVFLLDYLRLALVPFGLKVFHDLRLKESLTDPVVIASWGGLAAVGASLFYGVRQRRMEAVFGTIWFFATLFPVCGIVMLLYPTYVADRYLYIPLIGIAIAISPFLARAFSRARALRSGTVAAAFVAAVVLAGSLHTIYRLRAWRDHYSFWTTAVKDAPGNAYVWNGVGAAYLSRGMEAEAKNAFRKAIGLKDENPNPHLSLAALCLDENRRDEAERHIYRALELQPGNDWGLNLLGILTAGKGKLPEARSLFLEAIRINPQNENARRNLEKVMYGRTVASGEKGEGGQSVAAGM